MSSERERAPAATSEMQTTLLPAARGEEAASRSAEATWELPGTGRERYVIEGLFAQGGSGRILRAHDRHLERTVALKELHDPGSAAEVRFLNEARITARLQHPAIVPVYEVGRSPEGEPFYTMKLVSGRSLARQIDSALRLEERLALLPHVLALAEAMAYAHSRRIIHRDLKPANVLVGEFGETVVIDWGLAKELGRAELPTGPQPPAAPRGPEHTEVGTIMGTPAYMPPEQASGQRVDERADVYALGAILYHLLTGHPPYEGSTSQEVIQQVLSRDPQPLEREQPRLPQELRDIVSRAMARDPGERYPSARELAEDLRRFQTGQLVGAHRYSAWELVGRFLRRHRAALAVGWVALAVVAALGVWSVRRVLAERDEARAARREAALRADEMLLEQVRTRASPSEALGLFGQLSPFFSRWGAARVLAAEAVAQGLATRLRGHTGTLNDVAFSPDGRYVATTSDDRSVRLWEVQGGSGRVVGQHEDEAWRCLFSEDGRWLVTSGKDGTVRLWGLRGGEPRVLRHERPVNGVVLLDPRGQRLATSDMDGNVWVWEVERGERRLLFRHVGGRRPVLALSADRRWLLSAALGGQGLMRWDTVEDKVAVLGVAEGARWPLAISSRGAVLSANARQQVLLWEPGSSALRVLGQHESAIMSLTLSADGRLAASLDTQGQVWLWEVESGRLKGTRELPASSRRVLFSPDGQWLAGTGSDGTLLLWEVGTGRHHRVRAASEALSALDYSEDGTKLAVASHDAQALVLELEPRRGRVQRVLEEPVRSADLSVDGRHLLVAGNSGAVRLWHLEEPAPVELAGHTQEVSQVRLGPGGTVLATAEQGGTVWLWDGAGRQRHELKGHGALVRALAFSPEGAWLASGDEQGEVWLWEAASGRGRRLGSQGGAVRTLAFAPDGQQLLSGGGDQVVWLWELPGGTARRLHRHQDTVSAVAFSPDGRYLASGSEDHTVWLQERPTGMGRRMDVSAMGVQALLFAHQGQYVLNTSRTDHAVRLWDVDTGRPWGPGALHSLNTSVTRVALSAEGRRLAGASIGGTVWLWDLESGEGRALRGHQGPALLVAFAPDGKSLLSLGQDGTLRTWQDDLPLDPEPLRVWLQAAREQY
jgi:eukaryotic-like serine/threonine-protein kinase